MYHSAVCGSLVWPLSGLGLSQDVAGATFMAAGSSAPELVTAFLGNQPPSETVCTRWHQHAHHHLCGTPQPGTLTLPYGNRKGRWPVIRSFPLSALYFFHQSLLLASKLRCALYWMCVRCVCDKGGHWGQHHCRISCLQPARNQCCLWTFSTYGTFGHNNTQYTHEYYSSANSLCVSVSLLLSRSGRMTVFYKL